MDSRYPVHDAIMRPWLASNLPDRLSLFSVGHAPPVERWHGWTFDRAVLLFAAVLLAGIWVQLTLMHWAGAFRRKAMWGPVVATPVFVIAAVAGAFYRQGAFGVALTVVLALAVVEGLVGVALHVRGIAAQIGGLSVRNLLVGPPPVLPLAYALTAGLAIASLVWNG
jgi:hypothetical protein